MASVYHVKDFGAFPNTSCGAEMQTAINTAGADLGSTLLWDPGEYWTTQQLYQPYHALKLEGCGAGWPSQATGAFITRGATIIKATASMQQLFRMQPPSDPVAGLRLANASVNNICFDSNLMAQFGFVAKSVVDCSFPRISSIRSLSYAIWIGIVPDGDLPKTGVGGATYTEPRDTQHNMFGKIFTDTRSNGAYGIYTHGDDIANVSLNNFTDVTYWHKDGIGFYLDNGDGNTFAKVTGYRHPSGAGIGMAFGAGTSLYDYSRHNCITYSQFGAGGCTAMSGTKPSLDNRILRYSSDNGTPNPVVQPGATLIWN